LSRSAAEHHTSSNESSHSESDNDNKEVGNKVIQVLKNTANKWQQSSNTKRAAKGGFGAFLQTLIDAVISEISYRVYTDQYLHLLELFKVGLTNTYDVKDFTKKPTREHFLRDFVVAVMKSAGSSSSIEDSKKYILDLKVFS
jgi:hypothetical protein